MRLGAQERRITSGADGALWVLQPGTNRVSRMATEGASNSYPVPTAASLLSDIVTGPEGVLMGPHARCLRNG